MDNYAIFGSSVLANAELSLRMVDRASSGDDQADWRNGRAALQVCHVGQSAPASSRPCVFLVLLYLREMDSEVGAGSFGFRKKSGQTGDQT